MSPDLKMLIKGGNWAVLGLGRDTRHALCFPLLANTEMRFLQHFFLKRCHREQEASYLPLDEAGRGV